MSYQSINPATGEVLKSFEEMTGEQLEIALETAAGCFEKWRKMSFAQRAVVATGGRDHAGAR